MKTERLAICCINCEMWFDTSKGWQANKAPIPFNIQVCPCCGAPLMQFPYNDFILKNIEKDRLTEVKTWEYPNGEFWERKNKEE